jgi:hypothetical protein
MLVRRPWSASGLLCAVWAAGGCRAASWLDCERWHIRMAVPDGGVGGPLGVVEQLSGRRNFDSVERVDLVSCGR